MNSFNDKFVSDDLERVNEIELLKERLLEEQAMITGQDEEVSLLSSKRKIIEGINRSVDQFNEITKMTRDSSRRNLKSEQALNELIAKNKLLQEECA